MRIPRITLGRSIVFSLWGIAALLNLTNERWAFTILELFIIWLLWVLYLAEDRLQDAQERAQIWRDARNGL